MSKKSAVISEQYYKGIQMLPIEQQGEAYNAYLEYAFYGKEYQGDNLAIKVLLASVISSIDKANENYKKKVEHIKKVNASRNNAVHDCDNTVHDCDNTVHDCDNAVSVTVTDTVTVNNIKEKGTKVPQKKSLSFDQAAAVVDEQCDESLKAELGKWTQYKYQRKEPYTHIGLTALISRANKAVTAHGCTAVEEVIEDSISSEYKGIVWDKLTRAAPKRKTKDDELDEFLKRKAAEDDEIGLQPDSEFFEGLSRYDYASNL